MSQDQELSTAILTFLGTEAEYKYLPYITSYLRDENIISYDWSKEGNLRETNLKVSLVLQKLKRKGIVDWDEQSGWYLVAERKVQDKAKIINTLETIIADMESDAVNFQGKPFNGATVGEYLGNLGAAVAALAEIMKKSN